MTEAQMVQLLFVAYLLTVVGRIAYELGKSKGAEEERHFGRSFYGVGSIYRVGDDGRLYRVDQSGKEEA